MRTCAGKCQPGIKIRPVERTLIDLLFTITRNFFQFPRSVVSVMITNRVVKDTTVLYRL